MSFEVDWDITEPHKIGKCIVIPGPFKSVYSKFSDIVILDSIKRTNNQGLALIFFSAITCENTNVLVGYGFLEKEDK